MYSLIKQRKTKTDASSFLHRCNIQKRPRCHWTPFLAKAAQKEQWLHIVRAAVPGASQLAQQRIAYIPS